MISAQQTDLISNWFKIFEPDYVSMDLILPNGQFGRPGDGAVGSLTMLSLRKHRLILEFDDYLLLTFSNLNSVSIDDELDDEFALVFSEFSQFIFDWQTYGDMVPQASVFISGKVTLEPGIPMKDLSRYRKIFGLD